MEQVRHWHNQVAARVADYSATSSDAWLQRSRQSSMACCIMRPRGAGLQREGLISEAPRSLDSLTSHAVGTSGLNRTVAAVEGEAERAMARLMLRRQQSHLSPVASPLKTSSRPPLQGEVQMETEAT